MGQKLIFFNGVASTQFVWRDVIKALGGRFETITFDFRNHGHSAAACDHSFDAFLTDANAVMAQFGSGKPVAVGWSFGADLALAYAATHRDALAGLVIVDGALPISAPLVEDERAMRRLLNGFSMKLSVLLMKITPFRYALGGDAIADIAVDLDARRQKLADVYAEVDCPVLMLLATRTAGPDNTAHSRRNNRLWRESGEQLAVRFPAIEVKWFDAGHRLPLTKPAELAREIERFTAARRSD
jgi:pimeloyl-ACP methyl ester carboxylesterase